MTHKERAEQVWEYYDYDECSSVMIKHLQQAFQEVASTAREEALYDATRACFRICYPTADDVKRGYSDIFSRIRNRLIDEIRALKGTV